MTNHACFVVCEQDVTKALHYYYVTTIGKSVDAMHPQVYNIYVSGIIHGIIRPIYLLDNRSKLFRNDYLSVSICRKLVKRMKNEKINAFLASFQNKQSPSEAKGAVNLLIFQLIYLALLLATMILVICVNHGERLRLYLLLVSGIMLIVSLGLLNNLKANYRVATWLTAICMVLGPWASILLDPAVMAGDFMPLIYIAMSIQLSSILLRERTTMIVAVIQLCGVIAVIVLSPPFRAVNWPSLVAFIVFTAVIGILYGFSNRRQLREIESQRNKLLQDEAKLRELSVRDPLTGLFNRRYMEETFDREISRAMRKQKPLAVIMTDIDGFKAINDLAGHVLGDKALSYVSSYFMGSIRASDVACRFGGDEFCLILPDCSLEEGIRRANMLRNGVESLSFDAAEPFGIHGVTMSFGVAALPENGVTREALLSAADNALYSAKREGRNRVKSWQIRD